MRILALGAHADDVELGCGGSLLRWAAEGHEIVLYVATDSAYAAPDGRPVRTAQTAAREAEASARRLGAQLVIGSFRALELTFAEPLNTTLAALFEEVRPDLALVHHSADTHPDHRALSLATSHASRRCHRLLGYASNWYVSPDIFDPRMSVDISETLEEKLALIELFESENGRTGGVWQEHARALAAVQGRRCGVRYAEAFQVVKYRL
ncbi:LmbE family N-acetylglucosaminyl deacetylase [Azospirillum agricola]|uniref:PIG-L deacetylase family protein n=1 Tax=Azospirillum agricola TaxID=1720247 RepID=UPI001AE8B81C|nr:PIG-L deacetylase family protein [Azospirillum agricola]MBP2233374.1 LmbE family N-acetylglucosaminyl deacetylase [Azospirillum agricola]